MKNPRLFLFILSAGAISGLPVLRAQNLPPGQRIPDIGYVYPAGGQRGAKVQVVVGGQFFDGVNDAHFSGGGVTAKIVKHTKPPTQRQINEIREKMDQAREEMRESDEGRRLFMQHGREGMMEILAERAGVSMEDLTAMRKLLEARNDPKKQLNPQLAETVFVELEISADAKPGERELRLMTATGLSDPVRFHIGRLPEVQEQEPNDKIADAEVKIPLPATVNGQILPGDVDRFRFTGKKGQKLVVAASARDLIPNLADAVPGWFQATLALYDANGRELAYADDFRFNPDPVLHYEIPADGEYELEIKDAIYRGREDFVYRVTLGELPFVTSIYPLGGRADSEIPVELAGWNLTTDHLTLNTRNRKTGVESLAMIGDQPLVNLTPFAVDSLPETMEKEPNNDLQSAQDLKPPMIVNGRIDRPGDWDVYRFSCREGGQIFAEIKARRLSSPLDSLLLLTDAQGKRIAANDDYEDKGAGLVTHHADSRIGIKMPESGTYFLYVGDAQQKGGEEFSYRLHLNAQRPDFELRVVPSSVSARPGTSAQITVHVLRRDGFEGDIRLALKDAPEGFHLGGGWIPSGHDSMRMTLTVPAEALEEPIPLAMEGRARIGGREVIHRAVPAEDMMQAFIYHHLIPANDWMVSVADGGMGNRLGGKGRFRGFGSLAETAPENPVISEPVKLNAGEPTSVIVPTPGAGRIPALNEIELELSDPPEGITLGEFSVGNGEVTLQLQVEPGKVEKGLRGNLIVDASIERQMPAREGQAEGRSFRIPLGVLPAIPFEVVGKAK